MSSPELTGTITMVWQPIESAPENTIILVWKPYMGGLERIQLDRFTWCEYQIDEDVEIRKEGNMTFRTTRTNVKRERNWEGSGGDWWMPMPDPPLSTYSTQEKP